MKLKHRVGILFLGFALMGLSLGETAPDFEAKNQDGKLVHLAEFRGKPVLIYFYPKDQTPGCTQEACRFRDEFSNFKKLGAVVLGVSTQDAKSHQEFKARHKLPFDLLVDSDGSIADVYGVKKIPFLGLLKRQSVLIGPNGKVVRFYADVNPKSHATEVLKDLQELQKTAPQP